MTHSLDEGPGDRSWRSLYVAGAVAALVFVGGSLLDIVLTMLPGWGAGSVPVTAAAWFAQFAADPLLGMRNLDFLNISLSLIALPMYAALFGAHRRAEPALALTALVVVAIGTALFVASNAALPMLELSRRYATAAASDRAALEAAAQALLSRGAHGSFGAFLGFFVSEVGTLLMSVAMLRGRVFGRGAALAGVVGASVLAVYTTAITFAPGASILVSVVAIPGGLLMMGWDVAVARRLLRLAGSAPGPAARAVPATAV